MRCVYANKERKKKQKEMSERSGALLLAVDVQ